MEGNGCGLVLCSILARQVSGGTEKNRKNHQEVRFLSQDLNTGSPEYEGRVLTTLSRLSAIKSLNF
jgi:hypothetical protein